MGFNQPRAILSYMSVAQSDARELIQRFLDGELESDELQDRLRELDDDTEKEELWLRWSGQGLFDESIEQDGWVSRRNGQYREVERDG